MSEEKFWNLIEVSLDKSEGDMEAQYNELLSELNKLTADEIIGFQNVFNRYYTEVYTSELWGAAYIINGGCSDDGFDYFRAWLISKGKEVFFKALQNPDSLAEVLREDEIEGAEFEELISIGKEAYESKGNNEEFYHLVETFKYPEITIDWDEDESILDEMFPRLSEMCN